jgi:hypothetical protein
MIGVEAVGPDYPRRGAADRGEYRQVAGASPTTHRRLPAP